MLRGARVTAPCVARLWAGRGHVIHLGQVIHLGRVVTLGHVVYLGLMIDVIHVLSTPGWG